MDSVPALEVARDQLRRMRAMNAMYHRRFFADVRWVLVIGLALFTIGFWQVPEVLLLIPFVALWGATQTAFDASYLIFSRYYAAALERWINFRIGETVLVGAEMEDVYLFPLGDRKIVTIPIGGPLTWFSFMTAFTTVGGVVAATAALWAGWSTLTGLSGAAQLAYWLCLGVMAGSALIVGLRWFVGGVGERRLAEVLEPLVSSPVE